MLRNYYSLPEKSPAFCASDIKHVAQAGYIRKRNIIVRAGKGISKPRAVQVKRNPVLTANFAYGF